MDVKRLPSERFVSELGPHESDHIPHSGLQNEAIPKMLDVNDFTEISPNRRLKDLQNLSPDEQDQIAQYWGAEDLLKFDDQELLALEQHTQAMSAEKRSGYSPIAWLSKAVGGRPYLENLERLHIDSVNEMARRKEEKVRPYRELDASLQALSGPDDGARQTYLASAKQALAQIGSEPLPDFLKNTDSTLMHRAFQTGDPSLIESAIRNLSDKNIDGHELLYEPDASGRSPTSYLGQDRKFASTLLALQDAGFDSSRLGDDDRAQFQKTRDEIAKNVALPAFMKPGHYWLALGLANAGFNRKDQTPRTVSEVVGRSNQYEKPLKELAAKGGDPSFWPADTGTTPLHLLARSGDIEGVKNLRKAFGSAWSSIKDSQGKLASDYASNPEMKEALNKIRL